MDITNSTPLLNVETGEYPLYLFNVREANPNVSFMQSPTEEVLAEYDIAVVHRTDRPAGDVIEEGVPELKDGAWQQTWVVREFTPAELDSRLVEAQRRVTQAILNMREANLSDGFIHTTKDGRIFGVQLRPEDRPNLLTLAFKADKLLAAKADTVTKFRSTENETQLLSPEELKYMCDQALGACEKAFEASWVLRDQVQAATSVAEFPTLPTSLL